MSNDHDRPPFVDLSFAALGWLCRSSEEVGSAHFAETTDRARFYLHRAAERATTTAESAVVLGLTSSLLALFEVDAEARDLSEE